MNRSAGRRWSRKMQPVLGFAVLLAAFVLWGWRGRSAAEQPVPRRETLPPHYELALPLVAQHFWIGERPSPTFGAQLFEFQTHGQTAEVLETEVPRLRQVGLWSLRTVLYWRDIEPNDTTPEHYNWQFYDKFIGDLRAEGIEPLISIVAFPPFATRYFCGGGFVEGGETAWREFAHALVARYSAPPYKVRLWEIGNEPDGVTSLPPGGTQPTRAETGCWGNVPADYASFLRIGYQEIKAIQPDATVIFGSLAYDVFEAWFVKDFFSKVLDAGGGQSFDVLGFHWFPRATQWATAEAKALELRQYMRERGLDKPLWLTETYLPSNPPERGSPGEQVDFILRDFAAMRGEGIVRKVWWYGWWSVPLSVTPVDRGLVWPQHQPKPGVRALELVVDLTDGFPSRHSTAQVTAYRFDRPWQSEQVWALWARGSSPASIELPASSNQPAEVIRLEVGDTYATTVPVTTTVLPTSSVYQLTVSGTPVFVRIPSP
ncbi:MAG: hypothetical protein M5U01_13190 [Ardenticatenaceae bacterium]|nr:hypothetical protein [Ardenticatenaceae bacterium]